MIPGGVTSLGDFAFSGCASLTNIAIPDGVTSIGQGAFSGCTGLTSVTIPHSVTSIGIWVFHGCTSVTHIAIPNSITSITAWAFSGCTSLTSITIPSSVTSIGDGAFIGCTSLTGVYFLGDSPGTASDVFNRADFVTVYYLPGTTGWGPTYAGRPTAWWVLPYPVILTTATTFGLQNNSFGFRISWATNSSVIVDAATDLSNPTWSPVSTNALIDGWSLFSDADWANYLTRFYRARSP
jgi:hypothetical protein